MTHLAIFLFIVTFGANAFADNPIFTLKDPAGDDQGDGSLVYPLRDDLKTGDLDIISLSAREQDGGTLFEATFAKRIVTPAGRVIDAGGTSLDAIARHGFHTFNIDIYIDTDRTPGSGRTDTIPGRMATIAPETAWEKMILLTPRPFDAQNILKRLLQRNSERELQSKKGRVDAADEIDIQGKVGRTVIQQYYFPTQIRVLGSRITFFVPASFLGGPAKATWAYTVAVTAADLQQRVDLGSMMGSERESETGVMIVPVSPGNWRDKFGGAREGDYLKPPLLDIIVPKGQKQEDVLRNYNLNERRPVQLTGIVPG